MKDADLVAAYLAHAETSMRDGTDAEHFAAELILLPVILSLLSQVRSGLRPMKLGLLAAWGE